MVFTKYTIIIYIHFDLNFEDQKHVYQRLAIATMIYKYIKWPNDFILKIIGEWEVKTKPHAVES